MGEGKEEGGWEGGGARVVEGERGVGGFVPKVCDRLRARAGRG